MTESQSPDILSRITDYIGRHLQCTEEQRIVLALWIIHTHCSSAFFTSPCLDIHSARKQAGKSVCLELLRLLCFQPWLTCGITSSMLAQRVDCEPLTLLLDEREATLGSARRPKNPALLAMLNSGFQDSVSHQVRDRHLDIFCPKAFAGTAPLPEGLAERSIPLLEWAVPQLEHRWKNGPLGPCWSANRNGLQPRCEQLTGYTNSGTALMTGLLEDLNRFGAEQRAE